MKEFIKIDVFYHDRCHCDSIQFNPEAPFKLHLLPRPKLKGLKVIYQLRDDTGVRFTLTGKDARGNNTTLGTPTVASSDTTIATATINADGKLEITPVGPLGTTQVVVTDVVDPSTTPPTAITGELDVTVVGGAPVSFNFDAAETFPVTSPVGPPTPTPTPVGPTP